MNPTIEIILKPRKSQTGIRAYVRYNGITSTVDSTRGQTILRQLQLPLTVKVGLDAYTGRILDAFVCKPPRNP